MREQLPGREADGEVIWEYTELIASIESYNVSYMNMSMETCQAVSIQSLEAIVNHPSYHAITGFENIKQLGNLHMAGFFLEITVTAPL